MGAYKDIYGHINSKHALHLCVRVRTCACMCAYNHACMHVMHVRECAHMHVCIHVHVCTPLHVCMLLPNKLVVCGHTHTHTHTHTCIIQDAVSVHTAAQPPCLWSQRHLPAAWYIYIYVYICIYVYMYMYIEQPPCLWSQRHLPAAWPGHPRRPPRLAGIPAVLCLHIWHI